MNLWLRFIWVLLTLRWRPRAGMFDTTVLPMRVMLNDIDVNGHLNNGRYLTMADLGRLDFVARTGVLRVAIKHRAAPIVGDAMAKFRKDLKPFERFEMHTRLLGWDDKWAFMEHRFMRGGRVAGTVVMRGLFRGPNGPLTPGFLISQMGLSAESPPLPEWVTAWHQSCERLAEAIRGEERTALGTA